MLRSARTAGVTVTTFMPPNTATFSASVVGKSVTSSRALRLSPPPWRKLTLSVSLGPVSSMTASQSRNVRSRRPRAFTSTSPAATPARPAGPPGATWVTRRPVSRRATRSEEHTSELQSQSNLVCRLLLEKKKKKVQAEEEEDKYEIKQRAETV